MMERPAGRRQPRILGDFKAKIALLSAFGNGEFLRRSFDREPAGERLSALSRPVQDKVGHG